MTWFLIRYGWDNAALCATLALTPLLAYACAG